MVPYVFHTTFTTVSVVHYVSLWFNKHRRTCKVYGNKKYSECRNKDLEEVILGEVLERSGTGFICRTEKVWIVLRNRKKTISVSKNQLYVI